MQLVNHRQIGLWRMVGKHTGEGGSRVIVFRSVNHGYEHQVYHTTTNFIHISMSVYQEIKQNNNGIKWLN